MQKKYWLTAIIIPAVCVFVYWFIAWYFASKALYPAWSGQSFDSCSQSRKENWGPMACDASVRKQLVFKDISFVSANGYALSGWFYAVADNRNRQIVQAEPIATIRGRAGSRAVFFIHGGGADRREGLRYVAYFLSRGFDYYLVDLGCHGRSPCAQEGLSFGDREHRDVLAIYRGLRKKYTTLIAYGTSVGATSILVALPDMPDLSAVIAENPMYGVKRFFQDTPAKPGFFPPFYMDYISNVIFERGRFDGLATPANSLRTGIEQPIFFMHGQKDDLIPVQHSRELCQLHAAQKRFWISAEGHHARIKNYDSARWYIEMDAFLNARYTGCND